MKLTPENKSQIVELFRTMKSKLDLLKLLNYSKSLLYGEKAKIITLRQLTYYANPNVSSHRYKEFTIRKKSGSTRKIHAPSRGLKYIQSSLNLIFQVIYQPHAAATGFVPQKSIVDNAKYHTGFNYVYNVDLKDFFPSIDQARLWKRLQYPPFNLNSPEISISKENLLLYRAMKIPSRLFLAEIIASLCCHNIEVERLNKEGEWVKVYKNVLPQGAPTSPTISNIICWKLDKRLQGAAKKYGLKYSRYADDITFSSLHNVFQVKSEFLVEINRIITEQGFHINGNKNRLQRQGYKQEVTGLLVNEKVNVQKRYIKQLRKWLYYWERYGYERASGFFLRQYISDKGHIKNGKPDMTNVISGKLDYLKMVKGADNELYIKLRSRFQALTGTSIANYNRHQHLNEVLDILFDKGLDDAMNIFKPIE